MEIIKILESDPALIKTFIWGYCTLFILVFIFDSILTKIANEKHNKKEKINENTECNSNNLE